MSRSYKKGFQGYGDKKMKKIFNRRLRRSQKCKDIPNGSAYKKFNCSWKICEDRGFVTWENFKTWPGVYNEVDGWDPFNYGHFHDEKTARGYWKKVFLIKQGGVMIQKYDYKIDLLGSLFTLLGMIFLALKICGVVSWSWVWVFCPF